MAEVHERIYGYRQNIARGEIGNGNGDVIALTANAIFDQAWAALLDEFHVTDIADAMILGRLVRRSWFRARHRGRRDLQRSPRISTKAG